MATSFKASRDFARSFSSGSRMASAAFQDDLTPRPFAPGEVSPGAAVAKFAQIFLTEGARRRRLKLAESFRQEEIRKAQLTADRLEPDYVSPQLAESMRHNRVMESNAATTQERLLNPAPKTATPRALVTLTRDVGRWKAGEQVDPAEFNQYMIGQRALTTAKEREKRRSRLSLARTGLREIEATAERAMDAAESVARSTFDGLIERAQNGTREEKKAAVRNLGLPISIYGIEDATKIESLRKSWVEKARAMAKARFDREASGKRATWQAIIDEEAGLPADLESGPDDVADKLIHALDSPDEE